MRMLLLSFALLAASCAPEVSIEDALFDPSLGVNLSASRRLPEGLYVRDLTPPSPYGTTSYFARTRFVAHLADGTPVGEGEVEFNFGRAEVIEGYELGVRGMKTGGTRQLIIPPDLAYGSAGTRGVPGNAVLVFVVEVIGP